VHPPLVEQSELITRMTTVGEHIEHIKEIVAMQQSYAKVSGVYENLPATELIEDALRINATAFDRHGIELIREFDKDAPAVCVDRHKVLQILINLLRNAKHALDGVPEGQRNLWVRLVAEGNVARLQVADDGVGIAPELMDSLFAHGFTTRKDGHGFGLHSSALAAQLLKGRLTLKSAGLGQGAVATLELPLA